MNEIFLIKNIKKSIKQLIEIGNYENARLLINDLKKIVQNDIEFYSMEAIVLIFENQYELAEQVLNEGLRSDKNNFDLLYNLAYLYELQQRYFESLVNYRTALRYHYYEIDRTELNEKIDSLKKKITTQNSKSIEISISSVDSILLIDTENDKKVYDFASEISKYGINVDIIFIDNNSIKTVIKETNPYRKIWCISSLYELIEYAQYYKYDLVHLCKDSYNLETSLKAGYFKNFISKSVEKVNIFDYFNNLNTSDYHISPRIKKKEIFNCNLCIILPTYNRPDILKKVINNLANFTRIQPEIFILDSSTDSNKIINKKTCEVFKSKLNLKYTEFEETITCDRKIYEGLKMSNSDLVLLCPDDDFYAEEGIVEAVRILSERKEFFSVKGRSYYFEKSFGNIIEYDWFYTLDGETEKERLLKYTSDFVSTLSFQVFRREEYIKLLDFYSKLSTNAQTNETFHEYLFYFLVVMTGKIYKINQDLAIRNKGIHREFNVRNFDDAVKEKTFNQNYKAMVEVMMKYSKLLGSNLQIKDIEETFMQFLNIFLAIPKEFLIIENGVFNTDSLEEGMKKSWIWK